MFTLESSLYFTGVYIINYITYLYFAILLSNMTYHIRHWLLTIPCITYLHHLQYITLLTFPENVRKIFLYFGKEKLKKNNFVLVHFSTSMHNMILLRQRKGICSLEAARWRRKLSS